MPWDYDNYILWTLTNIAQDAIRWRKKSEKIIKTYSSIQMDSSQHHCIKSNAKAHLNFYLPPMHLILSVKTLSETFQGVCFIVKTHKIIIHGEQ